MSQAGIVDVIGTHPQVPILFVCDVGSAVPIANTLEILGSVVTAHSIPLDTVGSGNTVNIEVQYASAAASSVGTNAGVASFNSAQFTVDSNGWVTLSGTAAAQAFTVDAFTAPGTNPVAPNGSGIVTVTGGQVAAGTTANVIRTNSLAANTYTIQIQRSQAVAVSTVGDNGVSHFNSTYFTVDLNGFVSINGAAIGETITGDAGGALSPTAGNWNILGSSVAAGTTPVQTSGSGSTLTVQVQRTQAIAAADATKVGLAAFDNTRFTVDSNGFVSINGSGIGETITGTVGGALSPTAGNWNILGSSTAAGTTPVQTSGSVSTLTIQVQKAQAIASTNATNVGLAAFDNTRFTVDANGFVSINGSGIGETITGDTGGALSPTAGNWNILGSSTAAGTTPVQTSGSVSTLTVQVQKSQAIAATDATKVGLAAFDSARFSVDSNGFVTLAGAGVGETITGNTGGALAPTAGNWNILGSSTAAGSTPVQTSGSGSTLTVQVQKSQAIASTDVTKVGLAAFDSAKFTVDSNGFVSASGTGIGQTITGDTGGALSPTAGNWNIVSTATNGIDTSGSGSTLTVAMATPYADGDFEFRSSVSGATRTLSVTNTSDTASSQATLLTSVAGTTAGDTWHQYTVGTTRTYAEGIDNSDSQKLKLTTAAGATANPSTATPVWSFTPGTGYNYDNSGTSGYGIGSGTNPDTNYTVKLQKTLTDFFGIQIYNASSNAAAAAGINFVNDTPVGVSISCPSSGNANAVLKGALFLNANDAASPGIVYNARAAGSHKFYANIAGAGLIMTADSTGLTMSTPLTIGTQQIFTTRQTTPSAGTIGEQIRSQVAVGSATTLSTGTGTNFTSISLTAGVWDLSSILMLNGTVTGTVVQHSITTSTTGSGAVVGDNRVDGTWLPNAASDVYYSIPSYRVVITSTTTYYANVAAAFTVGTCKAYGRLSATRVA